MSLVDWDLLKQQDSSTSAAILAAFSDAPEFIAEARNVTAEILARDHEDASKLQQGIKMAIAKGVVPAKVKVESTTVIDVLGKTVDEVCEVILQQLGPAAHSGCILTLQGLSGTGKGTTVERLKQRLSNVSTWSNGNIFRSLTLLVVTHTEQAQCTLEEALTPELLQKFCGMLTFGKVDGKFDVQIKGLGLDVCVSEVCNTLLKQKKVSAVIPTVARVTQGEVIRFVQGALQQMVEDGASVLLEGRAQTLDYIRSPHRFELVLSDEQLIGKRRVAQIIAADALQQLQTQGVRHQDAVTLCLKQTLAKLQMQRASKKAKQAKKAKKAKRAKRAKKAKNKSNQSNQSNQSNKYHPIASVVQTIDSGTAFRKVFNVSAKDHPKYGTELSWEFNTSDGYDIDFSVLMNNKPIQAKSRTTTSKGTLVIPPKEACKVMFEWDNSYSWVYPKTLMYKVTVMLPAEVEARELEYERKKEAKALRKAEEARLRAETEERGRVEEEKRQASICAGIREQCGKLAHDITQERTAWESQRDLLEENRRQTLREIATRFEELQVELERSISEKQVTVETEIDKITSIVAQVTTEKNAMECLLSGLRDQLTSGLSVSDLSI